MANPHDNLLDRVLRYAPWAAMALVGLCIVALVVRVTSYAVSGSQGDEMVASAAPMAPPAESALPSRPAKTASAADSRVSDTQGTESPTAVKPPIEVARRAPKESLTPSAKSRLGVYGARRETYAENRRGTAGSKSTERAARSTPADQNVTAARAAAPVDISARFGYKPPALDGRGYTSFFGIEASGKRFAYVLDRSGSMSEPQNKPLLAAKTELLSSLARLDSLQQFFLIFYNEDVRQFAPLGRGKHFADDANKSAARRFIDAIGAQGGTRHYGALQRAINLRPDVIFLLTDGEPKDDLTSAELTRLNRLNEGVAQIHVIQFAQTPYEGNSLVRLAKENRGEHTYKSLRELASTTGAAAQTKSQTGRNP